MQKWDAFLFLHFFEELYFQVRTVVHYSTYSIQSSPVQSSTAKRRGLLIEYEQCRPCHRHLHKAHIRPPPYWTIGHPRRWGRESALLEKGPRASWTMPTASHERRVIYPQFPPPINSLQVAGEGKPCPA